MSLSEHQLRFGYWPSRGLLGLNPHPIQAPEEYAGGDVLNVACTQTGLSAAMQRKLVARWCEILPEMPVKIVIFSSKVNQQLFEAVAANKKITALFIKWSSIGSVGALESHPSLTSLYIGQSPALCDLHVISSLSELRHLFIEGPEEARNLEFLEQMPQLLEFGLSSDSRKIVVESLSPIAKLSRLKILWLVRVGVKDGDYSCLHSLPSLESFRTSLNAESKVVKEMREKIPSLKYLQPVW